jgi:hypothetical protein
MRSGVGECNNEASEVAVDNFVATSMGLLHVFAEEALRTAAKYARAKGCNVVTDAHVCCALKFQARTFFNNAENLEARVEYATEEFWEEMAKVEDEEGQKVEDDTTGGGTGEYAAEEDKEEEEDSTEEDASEGEASDVDSKECSRVAARVDTIVATWDRFQPTDEIQRFIKKAIDSTEKKIREDAEANNLD